MASTSHTPISSIAPSSSPTPTHWDVFLSFRGIDTRYTFTDHLYTALDRNGIRTFMDDPELRSGEVIEDALLQAIQKSRTYVVVFSKNYASSRWCLDELVEIFSCYESMGRMVVPVFYNIQPAAVRHQTHERFIEAFQKHETRYDIDRIRKWRLTLTNVTNFSGHEVCKNMSQADIINKVVERVLHEINPITLNVAEHPVGLDSRVKDITSLLSSENKEGVIRIGIYGMGGIGKTTLAKAVYNQNYRRFQGSCFLANVREASETDKGLASLQQLIKDVLKCKDINIDNVDQGIEMIRARICSAKVLIVIDDLDAPRPLKYLQGPFASGSIILITTKNVDLLDSIKVEARYEVNVLGDAESRQLFRQHAFGDKNNTSDTLTQLSEEILEHAGGLPLALEVFGSNLINQSEERWRWFINKLKRVSIEDIEKKLLISFDALELVDPVLQNIFLDITCFHIGREKKEAVKIMETCYDDVNCNIDILKKRCLLTTKYSYSFGVYGDVLGMHDLLRDMGRKIACNNSPDDPGKHSRLWDIKDIHDVMKNHKGTEAIEGIIPIDFEYGYVYDVYEDASFDKVSFSTKTFERMSKLRFLCLKGVNLTGSFEHILEDLRWLCWDWCPLKCLPSEFYPQKVVSLELRSSELRTLWELNTVSPIFEKLKTLDMAYSKDLITTPDFTKLPCLETLNLEGCISLEEVHISIGTCVRLVSLNLGSCLTVSKLPDSIGRLSKLVELILSYNEELVTLPDTICNLRSLEILNINYCSSLEALHIELGNIPSLKELKMQGLNVSNLPNSIGHLSKLVELRLSCNTTLVTLPDTICDLRSLEVLSIDYCSSLEALPTELGNIQSLKELKMSGLNVSKLPNSIGRLTKLVELSLSDNKKLVSLPDTICDLRSLKVLRLKCCSNLLSVPELPPSLKKLYANGCASMESLPNLSNLKHLEHLSLGNCSRVTEIRGLEKLISIRELYLGGYNSLAYTLTKRFFQIYSGFGHHIKIEITHPAQFPDWVPDWVSESSNIGSSVFLDLPPNVSHNFLATILYFKNYSMKDFSIDCSLKNTTSDFIWHDFIWHDDTCTPDSSESVIVIVPRSEFPVRDGDNRIELTADADILGIGLVYKTEIDKVDSNTVEERSYPSKRLRVLRHLETDKDWI